VGRRVSSPAFVGRGEQLQALAAAHTRAGAGDAGAVFIGGDAGVGKTRLVGEFERLVRANGSHLLGGGCVDVGLPTKRVLPATSRPNETPSRERTPWSATRAN
jgi:hypothetical protein